VVGNPAVYPPLFIVATIPLALLSSAAAGWVWFCLLAAAVFAAMWLLDVRDWRCHLLALTSPVVLQGLVWGNLTLLLVLPLALTWRYRHRAGVAGLALGVAIAAKLFLVPMLLWLLFTRRLRAAAVAVGAAVGLVVVPWAAIGFDGIVDYPALLGEAQDVYAVRSASLASVLGGVGLPVVTAVAATTLVGLCLIAVALLIVRRPDGDRRAFALVVMACVVASPIVWPNYSALLLVPIAITWPSLSPVWFFGYVSWLAELLPKPTAVSPEPCCRPDDVPQQVWALSHSVPEPWYPLGMTAVLVAVGVWCVLARGPRVGTA
jgi:alpha-1,2-mannosyltransferase